ncbi:GNAT family N-acetyltransferase [Streptomyces nitrosporeus]|uniref:GNAT family N-acetyltransferase n=1 Tax=Streptomyces nitrosporeus TaxID=28894 RepID=UPI00399EED41
MMTAPHRPQTHRPQTHRPQAHRSAPHRPAPFATRRLDAVPLDPAHADEMAGVLAGPALYAYTGGAPEDAVSLRARYERQCAGPSDPAERWWNWVLRIREDGRLAGYVQATVRGPRAEVAWVLGTEWQGRGYAKEAAAGLAGHLADRYGIRTVVAHIHPDHAASAAVAAAAGLAPTEARQDGEVRYVLHPSGTRREDEVRGDGSGNGL